MKSHLCLFLVIALTSCGSVERSEITDQNGAGQRTADNGGAADVRQPTDAKPSADSVDATERSIKMPDETPIAALIGNWTVTGVWAEGDVAAFVKDDAAIMGSTVSITDNSMSWSKKASNVFESADICKQPIPKLMLADSSVETGFDGAFKQFGIAGGQVGNWHEWLCGESGEWGPSAAGGSTFFPIGKDRLVMSWYDGVIFLLKKS